MHWVTACALLKKPLHLLQQLLGGVRPEPHAPDMPPEPGQGLCWATLDRFGRVRIALADSREGWLQLKCRTSETA
jgi:hypothetical protein